jgi:hypothetical protein
MAVRIRSIPQRIVRQGTRREYWEKYLHRSRASFWRRASSDSSGVYRLRWSTRTHDLLDGRCYAFLLMVAFAVLVGEFPPVLQRKV